MGDFWSSSHFNFDSVYERFVGVGRHYEKSGKMYLCVGGYEIQVLFTSRLLIFFEFFCIQMLKMAH